MRCSVVIAVVVLGLTCVAAQRITGGACPDVTVKSDFDVAKFKGMWYEVEKNPAPFQAGLKCNTCSYEDKGDYVSILSTGINIYTGKEETIEGKATTPDPAVPAKLEVTSGPLEGHYWILETDYENFAVEYSCSSYQDMFKMEFIWILSRQPTFDMETRDKALKVLKDNKISTDDLELTVHDCD